MNEDPQHPKTSGQDHGADHLLFGSIRDPDYRVFQRRADPMKEHLYWSFNFEDCLIEEVPLLRDNSIFFVYQVVPATCDYQPVLRVLEIMELKEGF